MSNRIKAALLALAIAAGIVLVTAVPASASFSWCSSSAVVCFATDTDGNGTRWSSQLLPVGQCIGVPPSMNDRISSLWNKYTTAQVTVYWHNPCDSPKFTYGPSAVVSYVGAINNDEISAVCLGPRGPGHCP